MVTALGARGGLGPGFLSVEGVAADAVEGDLATLVVVIGAVAPVVVEPEGPHPAENDEAVEQDIEGEVGRRHAEEGSRRGAKTPRGKTLHIICPLTHRSKMSPIKHNPDDTGHTAQYASLAEALRLAVEDLDSDIGELRKRGLSESAATLRIKARTATITVIAAALCESTANTILAIMLEPEEFNKLEAKTTQEKWMRRIPEALGGSLLKPALTTSLSRLFRVRHAIIHAKAKVYIKHDKPIHSGTVDHWDELDIKSACEFAELPSKLLESIPHTAPFVIKAIGCTLRERRPLMKHIKLC